MAGEHRPRQRYGEAFWRAHHEAWKCGVLKSTGVLRGAGHPAEGVWQLAGEVQSRAAAAAAQAALPASRSKSQLKSQSTSPA